MSDNDGWLLASTPCPNCGTRNAVHVRQVMRVKPPGTYSLAGVQTKFPARPGWVYRCSECGDRGGAAPKTAP